MWANYERAASWKIERSDVSDLRKNTETYTDRYKQPGDEIVAEKAVN